jgi:group I intron endonuclease
MIKNKFYVYGHFLLTGEIFYIGKGKGKRSYSKASRNPHWKNKVKKHGGFIVSILQDQLDEELAFEVEKSFISSIGLENLVNMTYGGEGMSGYKHTEESCKKMADSRIGKYSGDKHPLFGKSPSEERRKKQSESLKGKYKGDKHPMFEKYGKNHPNSKSVNQYTKDGQFVRAWDSMGDIERELKIPSSHISECCFGKRKSAGGFLWRYQSDAISITC